AVREQGDPGGHSPRRKESAEGQDADWRRLGPAARLEAQHAKVYGLPLLIEGLGLPLLARAASVSTETEAARFFLYGCIFGRAGRAGSAAGRKPPFSEKVELCARLASASPPQGGRATVSLPVGPRRRAKPGATCVHRLKEGPCVHGCQSQGERHGAQRDGRFGHATALRAAQRSWAQRC